MSRDLPVNRFTTTSQGLVPAPGQAVGNFLRDDGSWQAVAGGGGVGPQGPQGPPGATGANGNPGADGDQGDDGSPGPQGAQGVAGATGTTGPQGSSGPATFLEADMGDQGDPGPPGQTGAQGIQGFLGMGGLDGDQGEEGMPIPGPIGPTGPQGFLGMMGLDGDPGEEGMPIQGNQGIQGITGAQGPTVFGIAGLDGDQGEEGMPIPGNQGIQGPVGTTGANGRDDGILAQEFTVEDQWPQGIPSFVGPHKVTGLLEVFGVVGTNLATFSDGTVTGGWQSGSGLAFFGTLTAHPFNFMTANANRGAINATGAWSMLAATTAATATLTVAGGVGSGAVAGQCATFNGAAAASVRAVVVNGSSTAGQSNGLQVNAGANASDVCFEFGNSAATQNFIFALGTGGIQIGTAPTGGDKGLGTLNVATGIYLAGVNMFQTGTFTATFTGNNGGTNTCTATWSISGNHVSIQFPVTTFPSLTTAMTITGLPAAITPAKAQMHALPFGAVTDNSINASQPAAEFTAAGTTITLWSNGSATGWTAAGNKGFGKAVCLTYLLN